MSLLSKMSPHNKDSDSQVMSSEGDVIADIITWSVNDSVFITTPQSMEDGIAKHPELLRRLQGLCQ